MRTLKGNSALRARWTRGRKGCIAAVAAAAMFHIPGGAAGQDPLVVTDPVFEIDQLIEVPVIGQATEGLITFIDDEGAIEVDEPLAARGLGALTLDAADYTVIMEPDTFILNTAADGVGVLFTANAAGGLLELDGAEIVSDIGVLFDQSSGGTVVNEGFIGGFVFDEINNNGISNGNNNGLNNPNGDLLGVGIGMLFDGSADGLVLNDGTIVGDETGILFLDSPDGTVVNDGFIGGEGTGVAFVDSDGGTVINDGVILGGDDAQFLADNNGELDLSEVNGAILFDGSADGTVVNTGEVWGEDVGVGFLDSAAGTVANEGFIGAEGVGVGFVGSADGTVINDGFIGAGFGGLAALQNGVNNGDVDFVAGAGVLFWDSADGTLINDGGIEGEAVGVAFIESAGGMVDNDGFIGGGFGGFIDVVPLQNGVNNGADFIIESGVGVLFWDSADGTVINDGDIQGEGVGVAFIESAGGTVVNDGFIGAGFGILGAVEENNNGNDFEGGAGIVFWDSADGTVINDGDGLIEGEGVGVAFVESDRGTVVNDGFIGGGFAFIDALDENGDEIGFEGGAAIAFVDSAYGTVVNEADGTIVSEGPAIAFLDSPGGEVTQRGTIESFGGTAILFDGFGGTVNLFTGSTTIGDIVRNAEEPGGTVNLMGAGQGEAGGVYNDDIFGFSTLNVRNGGDWVLGGNSTFDEVVIRAGTLQVTGIMETERAEFIHRAVLTVGDVDPDSGTFIVDQPVSIGPDHEVWVQRGGTLVGELNVNNGTFTYAPGLSNLDEATINFLGNNDTLGVDIAADMDWSDAIGDFSGFDNVAKHGEGTLNVDEDPLALNNFSLYGGTVAFDQPGSTLTVSDTLAVRNGATLDATNLIDSTLVMGPGSTLAGGGRIIGDVHMGPGSNTAPGDSFGTLQIDGDALWEAGSRLTIQVNSADPTEHDSVDVEGEAVFEPGSIIRMVVLDDEDLADGTAVTIVETGDGIDSDVNELLIEASPIRWVWTPGIVGDDLLMTVAEANMIDLARGRNNIAMATVLQDVRDEYPLEEDNPLLGLSLMLLDSPDLDAYNASLNQLNPEPVDAMAVTTFRNAQGYHASLGARLSQQRAGTPAMASTGGPNDLRFASAARDPQMLHYVLAAAEGEARAQGAGEPNTWHGFVHGIGTFNNQLSETRRTGFVAQGGGAIIGADYALDERFTVGLSVGYQGTEIRYREGRGDGDVDTLRVGPHVGVTMGDLFIDGSLTFGIHWNELNRRIPTGEASSSFDAWDISVLIAAGYDFDITEETTVTPLASLQYIYYDQDGFTETGGGAGNLVVSSLSTDSLRLVLGGRVTHRMHVGPYQLIPEGMVGWSHEFLNDSQNITARFLADPDANPFRTRTGSPTRNALVVGGGVSALLSDDVSAFVRYDGEFAGNRAVNTVSGGLTLRF